MVNDIAKKRKYVLRSNEPVETNFHRERKKTCAFLRMNCVSYLHFIRYDKNSYNAVIDYRSIKKSETYGVAI